MDVLNSLGHGFHEKPYENAMVVAFRKREITCNQQPPFKLEYEGEVVGEFIPDLIAHNAIVIDAKVIDRITDHERGQMLNYLRITKHRVGVIVNFKHPKLEWERLVL